MFCEKCGGQNVDGARFCANCGAVLTEQASAVPQEPQPQQNPYPTGYNNYNNYNNYNSYGYNQPPQVIRANPQPQGKSVAAIVIYMIAGAVAVISMLMTLLPQITALGIDYNCFQIFGEMINGSGYFRSTDNERIMVGYFLMALIVIPMIFQLIWAVLSFIRARAAGVIGLIGSIFFINHSFVWAVLMRVAIDRGGSYFAKVTGVPTFMVILGIAGLVLAIIQLTKKDHVK